MAKYNVPIGQQLADKILLDLKSKIAKLNRQPGLAAILVGDDPASALYLKLKEKAAQKIGLDFYKYLCNRDCYENISEAELIKMIKFLNCDPTINGIIVQLPLPSKYNTAKIIKAIDPQKDVDGFHPQNKTGLIPPTINAIITLLKNTKENLSNKKTLIIGQSDIFLKNLKKYLAQELKIKSVAEKKAIPADAKSYDVIIIALGRAEILKKSMIKKGAIIVDVGINKKNNKTVGDVADNVKTIAGFVSPVPGGVGPLTVAHLLENTHLLSMR